MYEEYFLPVELRPASPAWLGSFILCGYLLPCTGMIFFLPLFLSIPATSIAVLFALQESSRLGVSDKGARLGISRQNDWVLHQSGKPGRSLSYRDGFIVGPMAMLRVDTPSGPTSILIVQPMQSRENYHRLKLLLYHGTAEKSRIDNKSK